MTELSLIRLQWGRNFAVAETELQQHDYLVRHVLQWGRNFAVAETSFRRAGAPRGPALQWGRNFAVAETSDLNSNVYTSGFCFNGAATLQLRKPSAAS